MGEKHLHSQGVALSAVCHDTAASLSDSAHFSAGRCIRFQMLSGWKKKKKKLCVNAPFSLQFCPQNIWEWKSVMCKPTLQPFRQTERAPTQSQHDSSDPYKVTLRSLPGRGTVCFQHLQNNLFPTADHPAIWFYKAHVKH